MEKGEGMKKGSWTEQEDAQLMLYVNLFGDRRWDFIAKVSGLRRSGKSCRLRWVNYLHPGLKRGKMTQHEERLIVELHNKWGNRWSRIAQKLPGRTDNEIKNYWKTHMRKNSQVTKRHISPPLSPPSPSNLTKEITPNSPTPKYTDTSKTNLHSTGGADLASSPSMDKTLIAIGETIDYYSMDDIWKDIELSEEDLNFTSHAMTTTLPSLDLRQMNSLWSMNEEENSMMIHYQSFPFS